MSDDNFVKYFSPLQVMSRPSLKFKSQTKRRSPVSDDKVVKFPDDPKSIPRKPAKRKKRSRGGRATINALRGMLDVHRADPPSH